MECWACGEHHASARLSVRSLWPSATTGPSSGQGEHKRARSVPAAQRRTDLARVRVPVQAKPAKCPSWHCWLQLAASLVLPHIWQLS